MDFNKNPGITVVMPLFNAERFLNEAIDSILSQTYKDFELICVIDGCTDTTETIVKEYMQRDSRVRYLKNDTTRGAAYSRNCGMEEANGTYIAFLDGDDVFDEQMLELAINAATSHNAQLVWFDAVHSDSEHIYEKRYIHHSDRFLTEYCYSYFSVTDDNTVELVSRYSTSPWNKLYELDFIRKNKIYFQNLKNSNDVYFTEMCLTLADRVVHLSESKILVYARDHQTQSRISVSRDPMCAFEAYIELIRQTIQRGCFEDKKNYILLRSYIGLANAILSTKDAEKKREFIRFLKDEGIDIILKLVDGHKTEQEIENLFYLYKNEKVDASACYGAFVAQYVMPKYNKAILALFEGNRNIVLWGCGKNGQLVNDMISDYGKQFDDVVDMNLKLVGNDFGNHLVKYAKDYDFSKTDIILVSPRGIYKNVSDRFKDCPNKKIIDFCELIHI